MSLLLKCHMKELLISTDKALKIWTKYKQYNPCLRTFLEATTATSQYGVNNYNYHKNNVSYCVSHDRKETENCKYNLLKWFFILCNVDGSKIATAACFSFGQESQKNTRSYTEPVENCWLKALQSWTKPITFSSISLTWRSVQIIFIHLCQTREVFISTAVCFQNFGSFPAS